MCRESRGILRMRVEAVSGNENNKVVFEEGIVNLFFHQANVDFHC